MLVLSGVMLGTASRLPCPTEPAAARACNKLRRISRGLYAAALAAYVVGAGFVLLAPLIA